MARGSRGWPVAGIVVASLSMAWSVGMGAYAAHGAARILNEQMLGVLQTAVQYQIYHSLALFLLALALGSGWVGPRLGRMAGIVMLTGMLLFSGSLYGLSLWSWKAGFVTPVGGLLLLISWLMVAVAALRRAG